MNVCPTCKRPRSGVPLEDLDAMDAIRKPRREMLALDALIMAYPATVSHSKMQQAVYEDVGDEVPESRNGLMPHISKLRARIETVGWTIQNRRFVGYRLVKMEQHT